MATLQVDSLVFHFQPQIDARKYDESGHYVAVLRQQGKKAVDAVAIEVGACPKTRWLIEAKDFRKLSGEPKDANLSGLAQSVRQKVVDTCEGLRDASKHAGDPDEREFAGRAVQPGNTRIVLHLEPYAGTERRYTKLFPRNFAAGVLQKLRQLAKDIDPKAVVLNIENTRRAAVPWSVA